MSNPIKIFTGTGTRYLSEQIATSYGTNLGNVIRTNFSDGEYQTSFEETVRGCDVFIIQSTFQPTDNLFELLLMVDAAKRASAHKVIAVMPYFGWARQDRKDKPRVAIGAKLVADLLAAAGVDRVMTMDLHADQIQGFFNVPVDHLYASTLFLDHIRSLKLDNLIIAAPDMGGSKRANAYAKHLGCDIVICYKQRSAANVIDSMTVIGEVEGKNVIIVDDICDTAGTLTKAADMMMQKGALSVRAVCTHAILSGEAYENLEKSAIKELVVTDTIPLKQHSDKIKVVSVANLFADVINRVNSHESISSHFIF
ncbi:MAG: ribose-phosphate pyrophosphokinase [Bacteroidia bacterium]|nr:ribose-phosphate pyrophosphokinase [Bacteroidia bacterium]